MPITAKKYFYFNTLTPTPTAVGFPDWFLVSEPYLAIVGGNEEKVNQELTALLKWAADAGRPPMTPSKIESERCFMHKRLEYDQTPQVCRTYIEMVDRFVCEGWPAGFVQTEAALSWCYEAYYCYINYHRQPLAISDKLKKALFKMQTAYGMPSVSMIFDMDKLGLILTSKQYDKLATALCENPGIMKLNKWLLEIWIKQGKINAQKFEALLQNCKPNIY